jgi:hypothetical protein
VEIMERLAAPGWPGSEGLMAESQASIKTVDPGRERVDLAQNNEARIGHDPNGLGGLKGGRAARVKFNLLRLKLRPLDLEQG